MENKILAQVGGQPVTSEDVAAFIATLGQRGDAYRTPEGQKLVLEELINRKLFLLEAMRNLMEAEPAFKARLKQAKETMLAGYAIEKALASVNVKEDEIAAFYEAHKNEMGGGDVLAASHILVESEEKANEILAKIKAGAVSFEDAAKQYSSCPSKEQGGDLGEFGRGQMVPEFEEACVKMKEGEISSPVKTQFGYHLIRLNAKKEKAAPALAEVREAIERQLFGEKQQAAYQSKVNQLKILFPVDIL